MTGNLTFDATVNPDFAQVEADDVQVNLTRFSVFFPEKRLFFQERSSNFDYNMGGSNTLFYSRRIGLVGDVDDDDLQTVRIFGGARLVGRLGGWDIGLLDMQTAALDEENPSENFGVLRLRRQVINPYSYFGGIVTSRVGAGGRYDSTTASIGSGASAATTISPCSGPRRSRTGSDEPGLRPRFRRVSP